MDPSIIIILSFLFFAVALLYSSVGHGGASGYLAVASFFAFDAHTMSTTALVLNVVVAGIASIAFYRADHFSWKLLLPFILASLPMAFAGGALRISSATYNLMLAGVLLITSVRLAWEFNIVRSDTQPLRAPQWPVALIVGGLIGLLSGIVGVGGGIFLSPVILLAGWADPKRTAAASAVFIVVNSVAGLLGRAAQDLLTLQIDMLPLLGAAIAGGFVGSQLGAWKFSNTVLRRLLAVVLVVAAGKLLLASL
jgi:uncharacterized membrane protein YfcA